MLQLLNVIQFLFFRFHKLNSLLGFTISQLFIDVFRVNELNINVKHQHVLVIIAPSVNTHFQVNTFDFKSFYYSKRDFNIKTFVYLNENIRIYQFYILNFRLCNFA